MRKFERVYMRTLRQIYDTERQIVASRSLISGSVADVRLIATLSQILRQSEEQVLRIERMFTVFYLDPRTEASWVATALLRDAWEANANRLEGGTQGCAAALLALKRYEITLYESLLRWSEQLQLDEVIPDIRRSIAEELVQASALSELAYTEDPNDAAISHTEYAALH
ncbi:DUF892 family protein [Hyphomicrobium sp.]|uniref:DUF892 family protein n=1 Tax=Hyphomicrobium sp. TaxID=82 RepID=UPI002C03E1D0|nr:DUF892 family protein [Hyphomicrobium sp.]HRN89179.1 DUF892 family protein [Hyphomicrobium sp.]HRQ25614.1 DUF892 family protein [Hyphomicrobium sp.]